MQDAFALFFLKGETLADAFQQFLGHGVLGMFAFLHVAQDVFPLLVILGKAFADAVQQGIGDGVLRLFTALDALLDALEGGFNITCQ